MVRRLRPYMAMAVIAAFFAAFLIWPVAHVFRHAFADEHGFTLAYLHSLFADPVQLEAIGTSLLVAVLVTICSVVVSLPLAWLTARRSFPGKALMSGLLLFPLILPPFVGAVGMNILFARSGALSTLLMNLGVTSGPVDWLGACPLLGVVLLEMLHLFPVMYLNTTASLAAVDPTLEEAAANLGASPAGVFRKVTLPLAMPGLFAGAVLVFIWAFTELGTPLVFGLRRILPVMIYDSVSEVGTNPKGYAQVVLVLITAGVGFWVAKRLTRRRGGVATLGRLTASRPEKPLSAGGMIAAYLFVGLVILVAVLPHISVILVALARRWFLTVLPEGFTIEFFQRAMTSGLTQKALRNSLLLALSSTAVDYVMGFGIAWLCARKRLPGSGLLDTLAMIPLAVPGLVIAFGYIGCFSGAFPGSLLDPRFNPMILLAVSYSIRRLPYMVRSVHAGLEQTSLSYEEAAANLGASPFRVVRRVTVPLISANLIAGGILCFAFAMLEVSDSLILAQTEEFYPITKAIYVLMEGLENGANVAAALGVWAMALLGSAMLWASALLGKGLGQMFRTA